MEYTGFAGALYAHDVIQIPTSKILTDIYQIKATQTLKWPKLMLHGLQKLRIRSISHGFFSVICR